MYILLSPAKTLDFDSPPPTKVCTKPDFLELSQNLIEGLSELSPDEISDLMGLSPKLAKLNHDRYKSWNLSHDTTCSRQAIFAFKELFIGYGATNNFWKDSIFFLKPLSSDHPPFWFLILTPTLVILSIPIAYYLFIKNKKLPEQIATINKPLYNFLLNKWYFDELYDVLFVKSSKKIGLFLWKFFDLKIIDGFGPDGISAMIKKFSIKANKFQSGFIYQYAFIMLVGFSALLTYLIIK